ncbi:hypothetical protein MPTK1_1g09470 [Marchantia polymorpha subsp. ruderalis]|uniref:Mediator of RNA polymerase II transcription subunit 33A n=3 Tax=Marchantia polymorpha TaxID=3197 RepID=A0AAF6ANA1_MARPO|nr:hypothetical protein MARPO_0096s0053 [Marchantia polymorpha]BBM97921.1 hypothetical protein Mp_1g09470 [Marchantia polymorpha subsp. ruderalis]|eukprot:PTQ32708.1 hypothetical protein MARPO_0096s0053 [Marchantia polymorpha]
MAPSKEMALMGSEPSGTVGSVSAQEMLSVMQEVTRLGLTRREPALVWGVDVSSSGASFPSVELGAVLLSQCLASEPRGLAWLYLQHALSANLVCPLLTLALLTSRVIPIRQQQPEMFQTYLELSSTYIFCLAATKSPSFRERCVKYVDDVLQLSQMGEAPVTEFGTCIAYFLFSLVNRLTESVFEDWSSPPTWNEKQKGPGSGMHGQISHAGSNDMEDDTDEKRREEKEQLRRSNSLLALELVAKVMQNKRTAALLRLARRILPEQWSSFARCLHNLEALTLNPISSSPKEAPDALANLANAITQGLHREWKPTQLPVIQAMLDSGSRSASFGNTWGIGCTSPWLPFDVYMESAMEKQRLQVVSPSEYLADLMKALQAVHGATWHEVFLGLWTAALRLTHRDREWVEGPKPHIESRLCMLLSLVPLACVIVIDEEEKAMSSSGGNSRGDIISTSNGDEKDKSRQGTRRAALASSLQALGQFEALLYTPQIAVAAANQAAQSIASILANVNASSMLSSENNTMPKSAVGNMRHLIVEACISRGLLDSTAYLWISSTGMSGNNMTAAPTTPQISPWSAFMEGAPISGSLQAALLSSPAESLAELEKVFQTAISGPEEERAAAASILCGASLTRSWNVQEHAVRLAVRLLSPPSGPDNRGTGSHLIAYAPMLGAALDGMTSVDSVNILALYGMFPELAASLLPICEVFGSLPPVVPRPSGTGEDINVYKVFSLAFLLLIRLWKFHRPPLEHCLLGSGAGLGADLSLEYLLQIRGIQCSMANSADKGKKDTLVEQMHNKRMSPLSPSFSHSMSSIRSPMPSTPTPLSQNVTLDSFPKLKAWYTQHQACIASTLSGLVRGNPVHQVADRLLNLMFKKFSKSTSSNSSSNSGGHGGDERPALAPWDVIAAVPFVVDEVLTACSHGRLSPRDLTTGLREMVDFLPATVASFVSCCGAEVTRGLYKAASMNGNDWPSPAANLFAVEAEIQDILASAGVNIPGLVTGTVGGNAPASLPLPIAALVSLTITFKLDKQSEMVLGVAGPALETAGAGGPWPSMAVVAALWTQKMRRWHDFIVFNASRAVFKQNKQAVSQLLRSCFSVTLCSSSALTSKLQGHGGVGALLGHGHWLPASPGLSSLAPGMLYLRSFPTLHDIMFVSDEILALVAESSRDFAMQGKTDPDLETISSTAAKLKCVHPSLSTAVARACQASALGASIVTTSGGATLVQKLYLESLPTWLLSGPDANSESKGTILEGYAVARFVLLSGALAWGISSSKTFPSSFSVFGVRSGIPAGVPSDMCRQHVLGSHLEFIASGLDGKISIRCKQITWKAYVIGFVALMVTCTPNWIADVKTETLRRLATGLRWWQQHELAFALLERGDSAAVGAAAELAMA